MEEEKKDVAVKAERMEKKLKVWGVDLEKLKSRTKKAKADVKTEIDREVSTLRPKLNEARKKLEELKTAGSAASTEMKKGVENAWAELKRAFDGARSKFK